MAVSNSTKQIRPQRTNAAALPNSPSDHGLLSVIARLEPEHKEFIADLAKRILRRQSRPRKRSTKLVRLPLAMLR
jgi:hypothetical protein